MRMQDLDQAEQSAIEELEKVIHEQRDEYQSTPLHHRIHRRLDGQIVVPISIHASFPSLSFALLMERKAEQIAKQTGCRLLIAQCLEADPKQTLYVWNGQEWTHLP